MTTKHKPKRNGYHLIGDIRSYRSLTRLLGKLGIKTCREVSYQNKWIGVSLLPVMEEVILYGWGLKFAKDYVDKKYDYYHEQVIVDDEHK